MNTTREHLAGRFNKNMSILENWSPTQPGNILDHKTETITPAKAAEYLERNTNNRNLRQNTVDEYAQDMRNGNWTVSSAPIVFYEDGTLADGQHRLAAMVAAGYTMVAIVVRGLPRQAGLNIDTHGVRTVIDGARIAGIADDLTTTLVAAAQFYKFGNRSFGHVSPAEKTANVSQYREQLQFAIANGPTGRGFRNAMTISAIARAYAHGEPPTRLAAFSKVLSTGMSDSKADYSAIALRNYLIARRMRIHPADSRSFFLSAQNAISHFCRGTPLEVIRPLSREIYPLR